MRVQEFTDFLILESGCAGIWNAQKQPSWQGRCYHSGPNMRGALPQTKGIPEGSVEEAPACSWVSRAPMMPCRDIEVRTLWLETIWGVPCYEHSVMGPQTLF